MRLLVLAPLLLTSCASPLYPRPADTPPSGRWSVDGATTLMAVGADQAQVRDPTGNVRRFRGLGGNFEEAGGAMPLFVPELAGRIGVTHALEAGAIVGPFRLAAEARIGLLAERNGYPVSLALAQAVGYQPFYHRKGPWLRTGIDLSHRFGSVVVMSNLYLTHGQEAHAFPVGLPSRPEDAQVADAPPQHAQVVVREMRFLPALACGTHLESGYVMIGVVPWFTVRSWPLEHASCDGCLPGYEVISYRENFGASLVVGGSFRKGW